ncbi:MAG: hypothetical protein KC593_25635 [Myxococcales bacterium]|nr:hypothetical protein [Myxococcales bacterium]MCB9630341.1 hypothetical protein [Sandaracinaceae bacterium]
MSKPTTRRTTAVWLLGALASLAPPALAPASARAHEPDLCAPPRVALGTQLGLAALRVDHAAALAGCGPSTCGVRVTAVDRSRCQIELMPEPWGFRVRVLPRADSGSPAELQLNVSVDDGGVHQRVVSENVWAVAGPVAIVGVTERRRHTHGGEPARIGWARFRAWNDSGAPLPLALQSGAFLHNGHATPLTDARVEPAMLPPGESELEVRFAPRDAYQSWNDRFSVRVRLRAGTQELVPQAQWSITRVTPLRR